MSAADEQRRRIELFWAERARSAGPRGSRFHDEHTRYDLEVINRYCRDGLRVLDLGAGTCDVLNALAACWDVRALAVEAQAAFLESARRSARLRTMVADLRQFRSEEQFDLVLLLGVISSFPDLGERRALYDKVNALMPRGGRFLLKSQFGVQGPVTVDKHSDELGAHYLAHYPHIDAEEGELRKWFVVERLDPYPSHLHRFAETHFYFLSCEKR
jgi:SAM-dependent methyltransferase